MTLFSPYEESYPPSIYAPPTPPPGPDPGSASPGDVFPAEPTVTAEDATNAAKLGPLGYVADPTDPWAADDYMTVGTFRFYWDGAAWQPGANPPALFGATGVVAGAPGMFTPEGVTPPATIGDLRTAIPLPDPDDAWTTDQYVAIGSGNAYWAGSDWAMGKAP